MTSLFLGLLSIVRFFFTFAAVLQERGRNVDREIKKRVMLL
jgi:hypothetical protein